MESEGESCMTSWLIIASVCRSLLAEAASAAASSFKHCQMLLIKHQYHGLSRLRPAELR